MSSAFYIGFDLSTQQLKALVIDSQLKVHHEAKADFDADFGAKYGIKKGVHVNESDHSVYAPVAMWLEALDLVLSRLKEDGAPLDKIRGVSGSGQQHGSVFWSKEGEAILEKLDSSKTLEAQLGKRGFTNPMSPNWQDASTQKECDAFDAALGSEHELAEITGSKAHHRFTGPQIMKLRRQHPETYDTTSRISLVSSFLASVLAGKIANIDISDVCGMNLWEVKKGTWNDTLLELVSGKEGKPELSRKLGPVVEDAGALVGPIADYYVSKYGFSKDCSICQFTGDNPATILALPLRPLDAMVSLGTSTTMLMATKRYLPDPAYHFFNSPTTAGIYMFMLCYKNGGLAREKTRDELPKSEEKDPWSIFNKVVLSSPPAGKKSSSDSAKLGLYFPLPEIVPNVRAGTWRYDVKDNKLVEAKDWNLPEEDARTIVESQMLSLRLRSHKLVHSPQEDLPPQPKRVYVVGGGAQNPAIARVIGDVLGGSEGVYKLDVGGNACALGGAYKAVWSLERAKGETFEELIGDRWRESEAIEKIDDGYKQDVFKLYGDLVPKFEEMEKRVLEGEKRPKGGSQRRSAYIDEYQESRLAALHDASIDTLDV